MRLGLRLAVVLIAALASLFWLDKCLGDAVVSRAYRARGVERLLVLNKSGSFECNYLKASAMWNEAIKGEAVNGEARKKLLAASYGMMLRIYEVAPGYRKTKENIEKMRTVVH
jgi:hypothetical protein